MLPTFCCGYHFDYFQVALFYFYMCNFGEQNWLWRQEHSQLQRQSCSTDDSGICQQTAANLAVRKYSSVGTVSFVSWNINAQNIAYKLFQSNDRSQESENAYKMFVMSSWRLTSLTSVTLCYVIPSLVTTWRIQRPHCCSAPVRKGRLQRRTCCCGRCRRWSSACWEGPFPTATSLWTRRTTPLWQGASQCYLHKDD